MVDNLPYGGCKNPLLGLARGVVSGKVVPHGTYYTIYPQDPDCFGQPLRRFNYVLLLIVFSRKLDPNAIAVTRNQ